jgi:rhamnulokinase
MLTAHGTIENAVEAMNLGAMHYQTKPVDLKELKIKVAQALEGRRLAIENEQLKSQLSDRYAFHNIIGRSPVMERVFQTVPRAEIYQRTGIQFLPFNSLYQLVALQSAAPTMLDAAERLLFMPDLFAYWLTGTLGTERTIASTSQMLDPRAGAWDVELLRCLGLPAHILPAIAATATPAGPLLADVSDEVGQAGTPVIRCAGHDTAAAVAAVPAQGDDWAYISSGTWSLVGVELPAPRITPETRGADFCGT